MSELAVWVCACAARCAIALSDCAAALVRVLRACDAAARALPAAARLDADLLGWPGLVSKKHAANTTIIRRYVGYFCFL